MVCGTFYCLKNSPANWVISYYTHKELLLSKLLQITLLQSALYPIVTWAFWELTSMLRDWLHPSILGLEILPDYLRRRMLCRWHWWDDLRSQLWCGWQFHASPSCGKLDLVGSQPPFNVEWSLMALLSLPALRRHESLLSFSPYFQAVLTHSATW